MEPEVKLNEQHDFYADVRNRPVSKKIGIIMAVGCCACALGYCVLINVSLQYCVEEWGMSLTLVQQLSNLPTLIALAGSLVAAPITGRLGRRLAASLSMGVLIITGILPAFTSMGFTEILIARGIGGFFTGILIPIGTSLAGDYFAETQKRFMMGYNMAFSSFVCGVCLNQVAGFLCASGGWRNTYWVFAVFIVFFLFVTFGIPRQSKEELAKMRAVGQGGKFSDIFKQSGKVWKYAICMFFVLMFAHVHSLNASTIIVQKGFGDANIIATSFSVMTGGGAVGGLGYAWFCKPMKKLSMPLMMLLEGISLIIAGIAPNLGIFLAAVFVGCGICFVTMVSLLNSMISANAAIGTTVGALALTNLFYNFGQYCTPWLLNPVGAALFGADELGNPLGASVYLAGGCLALVLFVVVLISAIKTKQGEGEHLLDF